MTVWTGAGNLLHLHKRKEKGEEPGKKAAKEEKGDRAALEAKLIVQAVRLNTHSKLTFSDSVRFDGLIRDVFPNVQFEDFVYEKLTNGMLFPTLYTRSFFNLLQKWLYFRHSDP